MMIQINNIFYIKPFIKICKILSFYSDFSFFLFAFFIIRICSSYNTYVYFWIFINWFSYFIILDSSYPCFIQFNIDIKIFFPFMFFNIMLEKVLLCSNDVFNIMNFTISKQFYWTIISIGQQNYFFITEEFLQLLKMFKKKRNFRCFIMRNRKI